MGNGQAIKDFEETLSRLKTELAIAESETDKLKEALLELDIDIDDIDLEDTIDEYGILLDDCGEELDSIATNIEEALKR